MINDFKRSIGDLERLSNQGEKMLTRFLDLEEQSLANSLKKDYEINFFGGLSNSERKRAIINKKNPKISEYKIIVYQIIYPPMLKLTHRIVLGNLMSLGIKRNNIGDIIVTDTETYFLACAEIGSIIEQEFVKINNTPITLKKVSYEKITSLEQNKTKEISLIVPSLRLDVILSDGFKISRKDAKDKIECGLVFINNKEINKPDYEVELNNIISFRHNGRIKLTEIGKKTKKERIVIKIEIYQ